MKKVEKSKMKCTKKKEMNYDDGAMDLYSIYRVIGVQYSRLLKIAEVANNTLRRLICENLPPSQNSLVAFSKII